MEEKWYLPDSNYLRSLYDRKVITAEEFIEALFASEEADRTRREIVTKKQEVTMDKSTEREKGQLINMTDDLKRDKEDMYFLATRAKWNASDWEEFERIFNKNNGGF